MKRVMVLSTVLGICLVHAAITHAFPSDYFFSKYIKENAAYFKSGIGVDTKTHMPYDHIILDPKTQRIISVGEYVNPTTIGLYLNIMMFVDKGIVNTHISRETAKAGILKALDSLADCPKWNGLFYWYNLANGQMTPTSDQTISCVDNANLCFSLASLIGGYMEDRSPASYEIVTKAEALLEAQKTGWSKLYDPTAKLMYAGYSTATNNYCVGKPEAGYDPLFLEDKVGSGQFKDYLTYHIDRLFNESRLVPVWAILATSDLPSENQVPMDAFTNMQMFSASYQPATGKPFEIYMTWDGTVFQELLPILFVNEFLISDFMAQNHRKLIAAQQDFIAQNSIPSMLSASSTPDNGYASYGIPSISESYVIFHNPPPPDNAGTPHATALSNLVDPSVAFSQLHYLRMNYPHIATRHGWYDVIDQEGRTCTKILGLDQGMFVLALLGHLNSAYAQKYLEKKGYWNLLLDIYGTLARYQ